jgi:hypothetical protein
LFREGGWWFRALGLFVAGVGVFLLVGAAVGRWPAGYIEFNPDTLVIARRRWRARIAWDGIAEIIESEWQRNPVLLLNVADSNALLIEPPEAAAEATRAIAKNIMWMGAHFAIVTTQYGFDLPVLAAALRRYAGESAARADLRRDVVLLGT